MEGFATGKPVSGLVTSETFGVGLVTSGGARVASGETVCVDAGWGVGVLSAAGLAWQAERAKRQKRKMSVGFIKKTMCFIYFTQYSTFGLKKDDVMQGCVFCN